MKVVIEGYYGAKNLGDDYLLCSILQMLTKIRCDLKVYIIGVGSGYDEIISLFQDLDFKIINRAPDKRFLYRLNRKIKLALAFCRSDLYIFGGGGLFPKDEPIYYINCYQKLLNSKKLGTKRLSIYGVDICGLKANESWAVWKSIAAVTDYLNFRNKYSADLVNDCLENKKASSAPDISFSYVSEYEKNQDMIDDLLYKLGLDKSRYIVWALAMPWNYEELNQESIQSRYQKLCNQIAIACNRYDSYGYLNVFLPFFHNSDCQIIKSVSKKLKGRYLILDEYQIPLGAKRALFKEALACVSMRFHGIAFSLYHGTPVAAISYAPKSSRIMSENGLSEYCTEFGIRSTSCFFREFDIDEERLIEVCDKAIVDNNRIPFEKTAAKLKKAALINEMQLLELLK